MSWPIFISYRRGPDATVALALWHALTREFGRDSVFLDVECIAGGDAFRATIDFATSSCDVMLVLIGERWAPDRLQLGAPYSDEIDFVQVEVASGLRRRVHLMPLLVDGASLPSKSQLPNDLEPLLQHQAGQLRRSTLEEDIESIAERLGELPELSGDRPRSRADARYVARMSKVLFPERPLASLAQDVAERIPDAPVHATVSLDDVRGVGGPTEDPEAALHALNEMARAGGTEAQLLDAQLDVAQAYLARAEYVSVAAVLSLANDAINDATRKASEDPRLQGLEVEVVVRAGTDVEPWMIEAEHRATAAVVLFRDSNLGEVIARFHTLAGRYLSALGNVADARTHFYEAMLHYEYASDIEGLIISLLNLGHCDDKSGRLDEAEGGLRSALRWAEALDAPLHVALASTSLGTLYKRRGRHDLARRILTDAFELAERLDETAQMASTGRELALVHAEQDQWDEAESWHQRVLDIERARENADGIARQLHNLASVHATRGEYAAAEGLLRQALETNRRIGRTEGIALQLTNLGVVLRELGRPEEAHAALTEALELNERLQLPMRIAETCLNLGTLEAAMGRSEAAVDSLRRAVELTRKGPLHVASVAVSTLADVYEGRGELELALKSYEEALPLLATLGQDARRAGVLVKLGALSDELGRAAEVLPRLREAVEILHRLGSPQAEELEGAIREIAEASGG